MKWKSLNKIAAVWHLMGGIAWMASSQAATSVARYLVFLLLSWRLRPQLLDQAALYIASTAVLGSICDLGVNVSCLRFSTMRTGRARMGVEGRFLRLRTVLAVGLLATIFAAAEPVARILLHRPDFSGALRMACLTALVSSYSSFTLVLLQARSRFGRLARVSIVSALVQLVFLAGSSAVFQLSLTTLFLSDLTGKLIIILAHWRYFKASITLKFGAAGRLPLREIAGFSQWIVISTAIGALQNYTPAILLSRNSAVGELATYNIGLALTGAVSLLLAALMGVTMPEALKVNDTEQRKHYAGGILLATLCFAAVAAPVVWFGAPAAGRLIGARFTNAVDVFRLLTLSQLVLMVSNPVQFLLYGLNRVKLCTIGDLAIAGGFFGVAAVLRSAPRAVDIAWVLLAVQSLVKAGIVVYTLRLVFGPVTRTPALSEAPQPNY